MNSRTSIRAMRASRLLAAGLVAVLALAAGGAMAVPASVDILRSYISAIPSGDALPTGLMTGRCADLATPPHPDRGHAGARRPGAGAGAAGVVAPAMAVAAGAPEDHAARSLLRAGRLSAPSTAPPGPS